MTTVTVSIVSIAIWLSRTPHSETFHLKCMEEPCMFTKLKATDFLLRRWLWYPTHHSRIAHHSKGEPFTLITSMQTFRTVASRNVKLLKEGLCTSVAARIVTLPTRSLNACTTSGITLAITTLLFLKEGASIRIYTMSRIIVHRATVEIWLSTAMIILLT